MKSMWLSTHQNWNEGIAHNTPSQNNGLESWNLVIKKEGTFRERMPLSAFLQQCIDSVVKWSKQYLNNDNEFVLKRSIDLKCWTEGYNWARSEKDIISKLFDNDKHEYYCPVGDEHKVTQKIK
jgi:hypothetical protein